MKYSNEFKQQCIEMYYQGKYPKTPEGQSDETFHHTIRKWVRRSEKCGIETIQHKTHERQYTPEEKLELISRVNYGKTCYAVAEESGVSPDRLYVWMRQYKMEGYEGLVNKKKGRPPKDYQVSAEDKVAQLRYIINRKDARIKSLEMENELMRDFLSLTGRK